MTINVPNTFLEVGFVVTVFTAIIGAYVYIHNLVKDMDGRLDALSRGMDEKLQSHIRESDSQLQVLAKTINDFTLKVVERLSAIETTLRIKGYGEGDR